MSKRKDLAFEKGKGSYLISDKGKKYLEEVAGEENYKNSMKEGDEHAEAAESRFTDGLHDSELFSDDELSKLSIDFDLRPDQLSLEDYVSLAKINIKNG